MLVWALTHTTRHTDSRLGEGKQRAAQKQGRQDGLLPARPQQLNLGSVTHRGMARRPGGKRRDGAAATSKPPFQCPDLFSGAASPGSPGPKGCLLAAKWPEAKRSQWPREKKGRRIINPGTGLRGESSPDALPFQCPRTGAKQTWPPSRPPLLPAPGLQLREDAEGPFPTLELGHSWACHSLQPQLFWVPQGSLSWNLVGEEPWGRAPGRGGPASLSPAVACPRPAGQARADRPQLVCPAECHPGDLLQSCLNRTADSQVPAGVGSGGAPGLGSQRGDQS